MNFMIERNSSEFESGHQAGSHYVIAVGYPICFVALLSGLLLMLVVFSKSSKLRSYSSSIYLIAMMISNVLWVSGNFFPLYLATTDRYLQMTNNACRFVQSFVFIGHLGATLILIILTLERVLVNLMPGRLIDLATNKVALAFSVGVALLATGLSIIGVSDHYWDVEARKCTLVSKTKSQESYLMTPALITRMVMLYGGLFIQLILITILGIVIIRKRRARKHDHVEGYISTARQLTKQLNRVNLIAFLMSAISLITNIPMFLSILVYRKASLVNSPFTVAMALVVVPWIDLLTLILLSSKAFIIMAASPKIRQETYLILTCKRKRPIT